MNALLLSLWQKALQAQTFVFGALGYYLAVTPLGFFIRLFGDPLGRPKAGAPTYWREKRPRAPGAFEEQG